MNLRGSCERVIYGKHDKGRLRIMLFPLFVLSLLYRGVVQARGWLYLRGFFESKELSCKVISVGNISLGGSGKTPTTHYIARFLRENNLRVAVLSRGYKGRAKGKINLVSDGDRILMNPRDAGDEPYMLAKKLKGVPILTSKDRYRIGRYAISRFNSRVLILDDGFQHIRLKRDLDVLLIDPRTIFFDNYLIPRGMLREPLENLKRADVFVVTRAIDSEEHKRISCAIRGVNDDAEIFFGHFRAKYLIDPCGERKTLDYLKGRKVLAFSGIANPEYLTISLEELGAVVVKEVTFTDHHWYSKKDFKSITEASRDVDFAVTTEKDMVKIDTSLLNNIETLALCIELNLDREEEFKKFLLARMGGGGFDETVQ